MRPPAIDAIANHMLVNVRYITGDFRLDFAGCVKNTGSDGMIAADHPTYTQRRVCLRSAERGQPARRQRRHRLLSKAACCLWRGRARQRRASHAPVGPSTEGANASANPRETILCLECFVRAQPLGIYALSAAASASALILRHCSFT